ALVVYAGCEPCEAPVVKPEVQNRLHHAGHGAGGARAHANQERSLGIPELLPGDFFELGNVLCDLLFELGWKLLAILVVVVACCSGDRKTTRDGQADSGHLRQAGPFASEEVAPSAVTFRFPCAKKINPFRHDMPHKRFGIRSHMQTARTGGRVHARRPLKKSLRRGRRADNCGCCNSRLQVILYVRLSPPISEKSAIVVNSLSSSP